jgi:Ca-activated chloride channel homolog
VPEIDLSTLRFGAPQQLWLLAVPLVLLVLWVWQAARRGQAVRSLTRRRHTPVREHYSLFGGLPFWLCLVLACAATIVALAEPRVLVSMVRTAGIDVVVLQDGSASMHVEDVAGNRWTRSMTFVRQLAESLSWREDRLALAVFARIAAPQVRLTTDPNTVFFFLDHLRAPPFRLEDDSSWDTNIERGIYWGLRLIERDAEMTGVSANAKVFVLISDGQDWSGEVAKSLDLAVARGIPVFAVGVGTTAGGVIPEPAPSGGQAVPTPVFSELDRASLMEIAAAGGGRYLEIGRETDREIATTIIDAARRRAGSRGVEEGYTELYWWGLVAAAGCLGLGLLLVRDGSELWLQAAGLGLTALAAAQRWW